jgi:hypothetical protein
MKNFEKHNLNRSQKLKIMEGSEKTGVQFQLQNYAASTHNIWHIAACPASLLHSGMRVTI